MYNTATHSVLPQSLPVLLASLLLRASSCMHYGSGPRPVLNRGSKFEPERILIQNSIMGNRTVGPTVHGSRTCGSEPVRTDQCCAHAAGATSSDTLICYWQKGHTNLNSSKWAWCHFVSQ
ncbi:hypothetical protein DEU56DRAFT_810163 [Suillus clintonianus]|uniref:uncharacterized protein n=1 Tax=Suillus clintonianus TaxID=1904413 RepID=UPI001B869C9D|nr:uncharacterized protein DEU56DRAFT_810163 [Suillus clintonianus]KAG2134136.1 hypothetical protein DEU56DRAFT_810163 [Suillus clintonianus]